MTKGFSKKLTDFEADKILVNQKSLAKSTFMSQSFKVCPAKFSSQFFLEQKHQKKHPFFFVQTYTFLLMSFGNFRDISTSEVMHFLPLGHQTKPKTLWQTEPSVCRKKNVARFISQSFSHKVFSWETQLFCFCNKPLIMTSPQSKFSWQSPQSYSRNHPLVSG